ncbi:protein of unknown function DUF342 [Candidatus Magnetoovum chiemensis]|nr:protein of unknown function DUF342 [Candidatus Magnetoovum chiemensis]
MTGDLNVTYGISHAAVKTVANIHTKFISDSNITGFNNVTVQKEIIESNLLINGNCSLNGKLISSNVSAKQGVEARQIGTESSVPPVIKVGTDYLIEVLEEKINSDIEETRNQIIKLKNQIELLSKKDKTIFKNITDLVQIMDKTRLEINQSKKQLAELNQLQSGGTDSLKSLSEAINKLETKSKKAEASVDRLFQEKDHIELEKEKLKESIEVYENKNTDFVNEKKILKEYLRKMPPDPTVAVQGKIIKGTSITGPNSSFILKTDYTKCVIQEQKFEKDDQTFFDMVIKS